MKNLLKIVFNIFIALSVLAAMNVAQAADAMNRLQVVNQQIVLLKSRLAQTEQEWNELQKTQDQVISQDDLDKANKQLVDKANLDIAVAKSNADSIGIELTDTKQNIAWLQKNINEANNQLNALTIFGKKLVKNEMINPDDLQRDIQAEEQLLSLEKNRADILESLQTVASSILQFKKDQLARLNMILKSRRMLHMKQSEVSDELAYQEQQNHWLATVNTLSANLVKTDPVHSKAAYAALERDIFYANEAANAAYVQSLIARYQDQMEQMRALVIKSSSLSLLKDISDQIQMITKQSDRLEGVLNSRQAVLATHIRYMQPRANEAGIAVYLDNLRGLNTKYHNAKTRLDTLNTGLTAFRATLDSAIQQELSSRQGFPMFGVNSWLDLGRELLIVPGLMYQVMTSLGTRVYHGLRDLSVLGWMGLFSLQILMGYAMFGLRRLAAKLLRQTSADRSQVKPQRLIFTWLMRDSVSIGLVGLLIAPLIYLGLPTQNYLFLVYLSLVYIAFKGLLTISKLYLLENLHHVEGRDVSLYQPLQWVIWVGGFMTAFTVFISQLPLIYELKILCFRLFLVLMVFVSLLLLRYFDVVPNLILSHMDKKHPYLERSIRMMGFLLPLLLFVNSMLGLVGYLNLVMTVSWYEGVFVLVLMGYLTFRGLLTDAMEYISRLVIVHTTNGWLWTEAFLKPIDRVLRIALFMASWAVLFLLYGWDKQSPMVERLWRLMHYELAHVFNTTITPLNITELVVVISVFYWTAKWTREFVYRMLSARNKDMGIRNSLAILSQYSVIVLGAFFCLRVLGIDLRALAVVAGMLAFGVGLGLRDLANNFACGFLILLERPLRVGDIVEVGGVEGEVTHIGGRAVTVKTWDRMDLVVPNTEIFNKSFVNWTAKDNIVRVVISVKISRHDNPHDVAGLIKTVLSQHTAVLKDPLPEVYLREMDEHIMSFELRYFVNIRQVSSRVAVTSDVLMRIWDVFAEHDIKAPYPKQEVLLRADWKVGDLPVVTKG